MSWSAVLGQRRVKRILLSAIQSNRLPHAYLFYGNEGVGKDAMAIELARVLQCEQGGLEACGMCSACVRMSSLQHSDVRLVFALPVGKGETSDDGPLAKLSEGDISVIRDQLKMKADNPYHRLNISRATIIKINSIRAVRRESALTSAGGRKKVFIISNADEMGDAAANTLLKTLEEPSHSTLLIVTSAHRDALLPTIVSRCQNVRFDPLTEEEIRVALIERKGIEVQRAAVIARLASGSYTRALELIHEDLATLRRDVVSFIKQVLGTNILATTETIERLAAQRDRDMVVRFLTLMLIWFRDALVLAHDGNVINLDQLQELKSFRSKLPGADIVQVLADIEQAISLVQRNVYIMLVLLQLTVQLREHILMERI